MISTKRFIILISLIFVFDALTVILFRYDFFLWRVSLIYKSVLTVYIVYSGLKTKIGIRYLTLVAWFLTLYSIGFVLLYYNFPSLNVISGITVLLKFLFIFILIILFEQYRLAAGDFLKMEKVFVYYFIFNNAAIVAGLLFNLDIFKSYIGTETVTDTVIRFGYKGFINAINETTGVYFFGLALFFRKYFVYKEGGAFLLIFTVVAAVLTGAKGCIIAVLLFGTYYLAVYRKKIFWFLYIPTLVVTLTIAGLSLWDYLVEYYFYYFSNYFETLAMLDPWNILSFMMSGRDVYIIRSIETLMRQGNILNFIFGGSDLEVLTTETDLIDGYFVFGIFVIAYFWAYGKLFSLFVDNRSERRFVIGLFVLLAFFGGHIMSSAIVPVYLLIYLYTSKGVNHIVKSV